MKYSDKEIFITGGAGFIGSHVAEFMVAEGARVTVLDNLRAGIKENLSSVMDDIRFVECDVRDADAVERWVREYSPALVFHLAANASVPGSVEDPVYDFQTNCAGTFVLLEALKNHAPGCRVVLASSGAVYGEPEEFPLTEQSLLAPISPYGTSKVGAETVSRMFLSVFNMDVVIGRIFNTYGPRMPRFVVLDFLKKLKKDPGILEILGDGKQVRDFNYVSDTVDALYTIAEKGEQGGSYNIASGKSNTITELAETLVDLLGLDPKPEFVFTGKSWAGDAQRWEVSTEKLQSLGGDPGMGLEEGLAEVINWYELQQ